LISHINANKRLQDFLKISGSTQELSEDHFFPSTDLALEWSEDQLLDQFCGVKSRKHYKLYEIDVFSDLSPQELETVTALLDRETYVRGEMLIKEGDPGRDLYILTSGSVSVRMSLPNSGAEQRLFTFDAGVVFGEIALLDGKPRSANVKAEEDSEVFRLTFTKFEELFSHQPQTAAKLMKNIALVLSDRLRARSDELRLLVDF